MKCLIRLIQQYDSISDEKERITSMEDGYGDSYSYRDPYGKGSGHGDGNGSNDSHCYGDGFANGNGYGNGHDNGSVGGGACKFEDDYKWNT